MVVFTDHNLARFQLRSGASTRLSSAPSQVAEVASSSLSLGFCKLASVSTRKSDLCSYDESAK